MSIPYNIVNNRMAESTLDNNNMSEPYADIIDMPHHVSEKHMQMSIQNRAAQFAPFAALTGHNEAIKETARVTDEFIELDENNKYIIDVKLQLLQENINKYPEITIVYFKPDKRKSGGEYVTCTSSVKKIDSYRRAIVMLDGTNIPIDMIIDINGDIFNGLEY